MNSKPQEAVSKLDELTKELEYAKMSEKKIDKVISIKSYLLNNRPLSKFIEQSAYYGLLILN